MQAFVSKADAVHINLGTLDTDRCAAIQIAVDCATQNRLPVLLDPVMTHVSSLRQEFAVSLLGRVTIIRANRSELQSLQGVTDKVPCIVETGAVDRIVSGEKEISLANGDPAMARTIATGCALGALIAILAAKTQNHIVASLAGLSWYCVAGEIAASRSKGPGSFQAEFLDALFSIGLDEIRDRTKLS